MLITKIKGQPHVTLIGTEELSFVVGMLQRWHSDRAQAWLGILGPLCSGVEQESSWYPSKSRPPAGFVRVQDLKPLDSKPLGEKVTKTVLFRGHVINPNTNECENCGLGYPKATQWPDSAGVCAKAEDYDETGEGEDIQDEAYRLMGGVDMRRPQVPEELDQNTPCVHCHRPLWRHTDLLTTGARHCQALGQVLDTQFEPQGMLEDDGALLAEIIPSGEDEVKCG